MLNGNRLLDVNCDWRQRTRLRGGTLENAWSEFLGRIPWQLFATLTFDPARRSSVGAELASREAFGWLCLVAYLCRRPVAWAYAVEPSRSGFWHAHAVIEGAGEPNLATLKGAWHMRNGQADIARVYDVPGVALYTTKQAAHGEVVLSDTLTPARFQVSGDVVVPLVKEAGMNRHVETKSRKHSFHAGVNSVQPDVTDSSKPTDLPVLLTAAEVAASLRTTRKAIYAMVERGQIPGVVRLRRRVLFQQKALLDWLRQKSEPSLER